MHSSNKSYPIVFFGTYDRRQPRAPLLVEGLALRGYTIIECHAQLWAGRDKSQLGALSLARMIPAFILAYARLAWRYMRLPKHRAVVISYPAYLDAVILRPLAWMRGAKIVWDVYIPLYEAVVEDRKLASRRSLTAWLCILAERVACRLSDAQFLDTQSHARYFESFYRLPAHSVGCVYVGSDIVPFAAVPKNDTFTVLFFGQFIPLHGIDVIVRAAQILRDENIRFIITGTGQEAARIDAMIEEEALSNIRRVSWVPRGHLGEWISQADVCLGIFGDSSKAARVIPHKLFDSFACRKPCITRDSPAARELVSGNAAITLVAPNDPAALARAILHRRGHAAIMTEGSFPVMDANAVGAQMETVIENALA